ncbi:hypothetical protein GCM10007923_52470 [Shinella yambaruensis]|uniref:Uncharacterized protein n=1 Tax=Shinella yambaruensis TaxID=415996 RepID=A0ABQ5ZPL2_9HYPH|nr:hypothetical protein GCM10007923_52470 [Shinella yambaruensis]
MQQHVGEAQLLRAVDDEAHGPVFRMGADIDDGPGKIGIGHARHGDQELTVKEAAFSPVFQNRHSHSASSLSIRRQMKSVLFAGATCQPIERYGVPPDDQAFMIGPCVFVAGKHTAPALDVDA